MGLLSQLFCGHAEGPKNVFAGWCALWLLLSAAWLLVFAVGGRLWAIVCCLLPAACCLLPYTHTACYLLLLHASQSYLTELM